MIQTLLIASAVALVAFVYSQVLTQPDMLLNKAFNHIDRYWPKWLAYPILVCFKCVSGQMAFWYYLLKYHDVYAVDFRIIGRYWVPIPRMVVDRYHWDTHILFVAFAIFLSLFYDKIFKWLTKK